MVVLTRPTGQDLNIKRCPSPSHGPRISRSNRVAKSRNVSLELICATCGLWAAVQLPRETDEALCTGRLASIRQSLKARCIRRCRHLTINLVKSLFANRRGCAMALHTQHTCIREQNARRVSVQVRTRIPSMHPRCPLSHQLSLIVRSAWYLHSQSVLMCAQRDTTAKMHADGGG